MTPLILPFLLALPAAASTAAPASVKLTECVPAVEAVERTATFEARMRASRGSVRMQLRFTLQLRELGEPEWRHVEAEGLDEWLTSDEGVRRYSYAKTFRNLRSPAAYRTVVRFRWLDADGEAVRRARVTSAPCREADVRPDLTPSAIAVEPGPDAATRRYVVTVHNTGRTAADPFDVALQRGAGEPQTVPVLDLLPGEERLVGLTGPACVPGEPLLATVDAGDAIDERDEYDNALAGDCPP